jgi:hypothetical protein
MAITLMEFVTSIFPRLIVGAVLVLAVLALVCGRRPRNWWLSAGCVVLAGTLVVDYLSRRSDVAYSIPWFFEAAWLTLVILGGVAVPLLHAPDRLGSRPVLVAGVLVGGVAGGLLGLVSALWLAT